MGSNDFEAWHELGCEYSLILANTGLVNDGLEVDYAVDELDELGGSFLGDNISIASKYIELRFTDEGRLEVVDGILSGVCQGAWFSANPDCRDIERLGLYIGSPYIRDLDQRPNHAFVPFVGSQIMPDIEYVSAVDDEIVDDIDVALLGEASSIDMVSLAKIFEEKGRITTSDYVEYYLGYVNRVLDLSKVDLNIVTSQGYVFSSDGEEISYEMLVKEDGNSTVTLVNERISIPRFYVVGNDNDRSFGVYYLDKILGKPVYVPVSNMSDFSLFIPM